MQLNSYVSLKYWDAEDLIDNCWRGDIDGIKQKINKFGADAVASARDSRGTRVTCLHNAAYWDHPNIITLLAENGADLDPKDKWEETPLRLAIRYRKYSIITTLIKLGADLKKAKRANCCQIGFGLRMRDKKTKAAIEEGQRLAAVSDIH